MNWQLPQHIGLQNVQINPTQVLQNNIHTNTLVVADVAPMMLHQGTGLV